MSSNSLYSLHPNVCTICKSKAMSGSDRNDMMMHAVRTLLVLKSSYYLIHQHVPVVNLEPSTWTTHIRHVSKPTGSQKPTKAMTCAVSVSSSRRPCFPRFQQRCSMISPNAGARNATLMSFLKLKEMQNVDRY